MMRLTKREAQVEQLLLLGLSNIAIGKALDIGRRTVENHRAEVFWKRGARNPVELLRLHQNLPLRTDIPRRECKVPHGR